MRLSTEKLLSSFVIVAVGSLVGLAAGVSSPAPAEAASQALVARVGDQAISQTDLEASLAAELRQLELQRYQLLEAGVDRLVNERLLAAEAARRGVTVDALLTSEVNDKVESVGDEAVDRWYEENKARVRQPKEAVAEQIRTFLQGQQRDERRRDLLAELRGRFPVEILLEPLRVDLELAGAPTKGPQDATITLVEFSDFQCPYCQRILPTLEEIQQRYGDKVRVAFRQFPLNSIHPQAQKAAEAALCAGAQGSFWKMHDALFATQSDLSVDRIKRAAGEIGLDGEAFNRCLDDGQMSAAVKADLDAGLEAGVAGTPSVFVNGRPVRFTGGASPTDQLARVIEDELKRRSP